MKFMIFIKFLLNWLITHFSNSVKIFHSIIAMKYIEIDLLISSMFIGPCLITLVLIWDARTARPCRVGPRRATWQVPNRADAAEIGADSAEIGADVAKIGPTRSV